MMKFGRKKKRTKLRKYSQIMKEKIKMKRRTEEVRVE